MQTIWEVQTHKETPAEGEVRREQPAESPEDDFLISPLAKQLLALRSVQGAENINRFLLPALKQLHDPFLMHGMKKAVTRILTAIDRGELIMIHGDYDVDGVTGAALLSRTLEKLKAKHYAFLPNRFKDGYGVSAQAIETAKSKGVSLMITVDCGITAVDQVARAREHKMDVIILDHHQIHNGNLPDAYAILNPLQEACRYPFKELSACGLAFKLSQALIGNFAFSLLDLAALSSVCDVAPLVDENRIIVKFGLDLISAKKNIGLAKLSAIAKLKSKKANTSHIGFVFGPRINASGRMSSADTALRLLVTNHEKEAESLAQILDEENKTRQREDKEVLKQAIRQVDNKINFNNEQIIVVWQEGWHPGVIGIVAQRLVERYGRPSFVIDLENGIGKGSARSVRGFNLFRALQECHQDLIEFGGHELAAGFSVSREKLESFRKNLNAYAASFARETFVKRFRVDLAISFDQLTSAFFRELELFEPFGAGNPKPTFLTTRVRSKIAPVQASSTTIRWWVTDGTSTFEAVWTQRQGIEKFPPDGGVLYDIVYSPSLRDKDGIETVLLEIKDLKIEM